MKWAFLIFGFLTLQADEVISWGTPDHGIRAGLSILKVSGELLKLFAVIDKKHIPLQKLLMDGFTVHASQEVNQESTGWLKKSQPWRGKMTVWVGRVNASYPPSQ